MTNPEVLKTIDQIAEYAQAMQDIIHELGVLPKDGSLIGDYSEITPTEEALLRNLKRQSVHLGATALSAKEILTAL